MKNILTVPNFLSGINEIETLPFQLKSLHPEYNDFLPRKLCHLEELFLCQA